MSFGHRPLAVIPDFLMEPSGTAASDATRTHLSLVRSDGGSASAAGATDVVHLLPRIAAGDELAVRDCVERYGSLIWALARRWSSDARDVEDAVQEVFVDLWRSSGRYDPTRATEAGWVAMVTRRRLIDRLRRRQRAVELEPLPDDYDQADEREIDLDRQTRVEQARAVLRELAPAQRAVLELSLLHGRTHEEIARETGTPLGTVKSHLRRGLQRARDLIARTPPGDPTASASAQNAAGSPRP